MLQSRRDQLMQSTPPASPNAVAQIVGVLFTEYATNLTQKQIEDQLMVSVQFLCDYPEWVLKNVVMNIFKGKYGAIKFKPSTAEMSIWCKDELQPIKGEIYRLNLILNAQAQPTPMTKDERERVSKSYLTLVSDLTQETKINQKKVA